MYKKFHGKMFRIGQDRGGPRRPQRPPPCDKPSILDPVTIRVKQPRDRAGGSEEDKYEVSAK